MRSWLFVAILLCLLCMRVCVCHAGRLITVDPYESGVSQQERVDGGDSRLAQEVTYSAKAKMVSEIVDELSEMTGVKLYAGYNKQDWQVRDRKMVIFAKDLPLGELMNSIARVMKFSWSKNIDADPPTYRLYMDRKMLLEANKLLRLQEEKLKQENAALRAEQLDKMLDADKMTPEEIEDARQNNPMLYAWHKSGGAQSLLDLFQAAPDVYAACKSGKIVSLPVSMLPSEAQSAIPGLVGAFDKMKPYFQGRSLEQEEIEPNVDDLFLMINTSLEGIEQDPALSRHTLGSIGLFSGEYFGGTGVPNPDDLNDNTASRAYIISYEDNRPSREVWTEMADEIEASAIEQMRRDETGEPLIEHSEDPDLETKVKLITDGYYQHDYLEALANASEYSVVSDCFLYTHGRPVIPHKETKISTVLESIQDAFHCNWERHSSVLEFRDRFWYRKRSEQIPESWLESWRKTLKETGTLTFDQLARISQLTSGQYWTSIHEDETFNMENALYNYVLDSDAKAFFGVYLSLSTDARKMLFSETGLPLDVLPGDVWSVLQNRAIGRQEYFGLRPGDLSFRVTKKQIGGKWHYCFSISAQDTGQPLDWPLLIPRYEWSLKYKKEQRENEKNRRESESPASEPILPTTN